MVEGEIKNRANEINKIITMMMIMIMITITIIIIIIIINDNNNLKKMNELR